MRFKTSCFNPTIARSYVRRFWPLSLAVLGGVLLGLFLPMLDIIQCGYADDLLSGRMEVEHIYNAGRAMVKLMVIAAFLSAALTFRHLHSRRDIQFYQSLPVKRLGLYGTSYIMGFLLIALPMLLGIGLSMLLAVGNGWHVAVVPLLKLYGAGIATLSILYSMAVLACCLAGHSLGAALIYIGMHCAARILIRYTGSLMCKFMLGVDSYSMFMAPQQWLTPAEKLLEAVACREGLIPDAGINNVGPSVVSVGEMVQVPVGFAQPLTLVVYGVAGVALALLAGWLYQHRRAEAAGETIAFSASRSLCKILGAVMVSVGCTHMLLLGRGGQEGVSFHLVVLLMLAFGVLGWFAAEMVVGATLRVFRKKTVCSCGILLLALLAVMTAARLDLFGAVGYVPALEEIQSAEIRFYWTRVPMEPEDVVALHKTVLENRDALITNYPSQFGTPLQLDYTLKNGRHVRREYRVWDRFDMQGNMIETPVTIKIDSLLRQPEYTYQIEFGENFQRDYITSGFLETYLWEDENGQCRGYDITGTGLEPLRERGNELVFNTEDTCAIYDAVSLDIAEGNLFFQKYFDGSEGTHIGEITISYYAEGYDIPSGAYQDAYILLTTKMTHTMDCLEEMGIELYLDEPYGGG